LSAYGEPLAFGGRVFDDSIPKYINSAETSLYYKGRNLFNLNNAKKHRENYLVVVEGYMDAVTLYAGGIKNVVATLGTAMTPDQARLLKRHVPKIVISYDMDDAGINGAMRGAEVAFTEGLEVRIASYKDAKDPDEYMKKNGADALKKCYENAAGLLDYRADFLRSKADMNNPYEKEKALKDLADILNKTDNIVVKTDGVARIAAKLNLEPGIVRKYVNLSVEAVAESREAAAEESGFRKKSTDMAERAIAACAMDALGKEDEKVVLKHLVNKREASGIMFLDFKNQAYGRLLEKAEFYFRKEEPGILKKMQMDYIEDTEMTSLIAELIGEEAARPKKGPSDDTDRSMQVIDDCFSHMEKDRIKGRVNAIQSEIQKAEAGGDVATVTNLLKEKSQLQKILKQRGGEFE
jgi:DNA primase